MTDMEDKKRAPPADVEGESSDSEDDFGPALAANDTQLPPEADEQQAKNKKKKRRRLEHEEVYVAALPNADMYEKSYMHRDVVTLCAFTPKSDFLVTASMDGHVKFWKKMPEGVEFVKHYHAHLGNINGLAVSADGLRLATTGQDKALKFYDVLSFDLSYIVEVDYVPGPCVWIHGASEPHGRLAVADAEGPAIRVYRTDGSNQAVHTIERLHTAPVVAMAYSPVDGIACSTDAKGIIEFWSHDEYTFPRNKLAFKSKLDTDLFELMKRKTRATSVEISSDGTKLAVVGKDKQIRVFSVKKGKLLRVYNESMEVMDAAHATSTLGLDSIDYGRRSATEHELEASPAATLQNAVFDETGHFLIYSTLLGVKIVNIETNRVIKVLGKIESGERFLHVSVFQGTPKVDSQLVKALNKGKAASSVEELRAQIKPDPTICCTSFKKRRFYLFTRRMPDDAADEINSRDVFNERPTAAEAKAVQHQQHELGRQAILRTTMGDIHIKLFRDECPKTVENFTVHSRNQYYDNVLFHRVIKGFMVQTGDPLGDGTGGESIWGGEFQDEFHRNLRHDRPFTVSMANSGPNTNGSQFFITTVPCPWLDNKHTVFGRVVKGMDVIETVSQVKTDHLDRPYEDIKIINVEVL